jgi:L-cystine uptake protein TcyP (sodium:dicarboxylate symporter family)
VFAGAGGSALVAIVWTTGVRTPLITMLLVIDPSTDVALRALATSDSRFSGIRTYEAVSVT